MKKIRLDQLVFDKGLAESRERAKAYIMAGSVYVNGQKETKPGTSVAEDAAVEMRGETLPYVSRGGWKLEKALRVGAHGLARHALAAGEPEMAAEVIAGAAALLDARERLRGIEAAAEAALNVVVIFVFENGKSAIISNAQAAAASQYYNYATSETIFFVANLKSGGKVDNYSVYTGFANMPSTDAVKGIKGISYVTNSKYTTQIDAIYMVVESLGGISDVQTYLVKEKGASVMTEKINGVQVSYYELPAIIDGEVTTARIDADLFDGSRIANATNANSEGVYALKNINKDAKTGIITSADTETVLTGTGTQADRRDVLGIGATKAAATYYAYTKDTAVYFVNSDFDTITTGSISAIGTDDDDRVTYTLNTNNKTLKEVIVVTVDPVVSNTHNVKFVGFQNTFYVNDVNGQNMVSATVDTVKVNDGSDLKFMPVGVPGVMVKAVKVGNTVLTPDAEGYYTLSAVSKDITVTLEKATAVTLTFKAPSEGAYISVNGGANTLVKDAAPFYTVDVASGSTVTLTIVPASGKTVSGVTSNGNFVSGSANSYSIVAAATGDVVIAY